MSTTKYRFAKPGRCVALVWKKDTYRLSRGRGFKMHYTESQCSRRPAKGSEFCWQHQPEQCGYREHGLRCALSLGHPGHHEFEEVEP